jgi:hypothetical protein
MRVLRAKVVASAMTPETYRIAFSRPRAWSSLSLIWRILRVSRIVIGILFFSLCLLIVGVLVHFIFRSNSLAEASIETVFATLFVLLAKSAGELFIWGDARRRPRTSQQIIRSQRFCGWFFVFLGILTLAIGFQDSLCHDWRQATLALPVAAFCAAVSLLGFMKEKPRLDQAGGGLGGTGLFGAGKPAPLHPAPSHHLQGAKGFPPSDTTHSLPKD